MAGIFDIFTGQSGVDAANAQISGINAGQTAANTALGQGRDALTTNYASALQPFTQNLATANKGVGGLTDALGLTGDPSQVQARLQQTPGYQFQLQQGDENVLRNQARTGAVASGATNLDLQAQGQGLANNTYQQYVQNLQPFLGASQTAGSGIAGVNTGLGNALNANYGSQANLGYTAATGIGNANANADLAQGKGIANLWGAGMALAGDAAKVAGGFAEGGKPPVGQPSVVGEKGPELFVPDQPGTVVPNNIAAKLMQFMPGQSSGPALAASNPSSTLARFLKAA